MTMLNSQTQTLSNMILEELVGAAVSLSSLLIAQPPLISRKGKPIYNWLNQFSGDGEDYQGQGVLHREYEPERPVQSPAYYDDSDATAECCTRRIVCEFLAYH